MRLLPAVNNLRLIRPYCLYLSSEKRKIQPTSSLLSPLRVPRPKSQLILVRFPHSEDRKWAGPSSDFQRILSCFPLLLAPLPLSPTPQAAEAEN